MAGKRMFARSIIDSDVFLDMPLTTQALYFHLGMQADDDGFVASPKKLVRMIGASQEDMQELIKKNFIIPFASGVIVIRHWKVNNYIPNDRYKPTLYRDEYSGLTVNENGVYKLDT